MSGGNSGSGKPPREEAPTAMIPKGELEKDSTVIQQGPGHLLVIGGPRQGESILLNKAEMTIGRDPGSDIAILEESISRRHAQVKRGGDGQYTLSDPGSSNGTFVNGKRLETGVPVKLTKEDVIRIGKSTFLKFLPAGSKEAALLKDLGSKGLTDKLTGVANKDFLSQRIEPEFKRAKGMGLALSVVFMDLDFFKKVNDTYGHAAGDFVLVEFTRLAEKAFGRRSQHDVFARYGGEEFVLVLPGRSASEASAAAEAIRTATEAHPFVFEGKRIPVTSSLGVAQLADSDADHETLLKRADEALYKAKQSGRNRVVLSQG